MDDSVAGRSESEQRNRGKPTIVVIGASAGGIQPLQAIFGALPPDTGAAFVVALHLDPQARSALPSLLSARTRMRVEQVEGTVSLQADRVYVIAPDQQLEIADHQITSSKFIGAEERRVSIDVLFRSLADHIGDGCAIILSGAGSDGAMGARAVKEAGGIILVQDPEEAEYSSMPRSAIATGVVDFVLPIAGLASRLVELLRGKTNGGAALPIVDEELVRRVLAHLRVRTGHDFSKYKRSTVLRRIGRRMQVTRANDLRDYYEHLRDNADEAQALLGDLLISVTTFFRDNEVFEALKSKVLPQLFEGREPNDSLRVWIPGCATGEEAYSIAMLLLEMGSRRDVRPSIQVFGSDLDVRALGIAREGHYPASIEADVNDERLRRFFNREGDHYRVRQELRDTALFAVHDLLKDPPFSRVDLISCRNLLIYLDRELQEQVCSTFHYALNPGGYLLLGSSETADHPAELFRTLDRNARIYQSTAHPGDKPRLLPRLLGGIGLRQPTLFADRPVSPSAALNEAAVHRRALEQLAPPSILVDDTHRVIHLSENAGRYIQPAGGPMSGDVVDLVRSELRFELRSALHRAFEQGLDTLSLPILVRFNGSPHRVHIQIRPISEEAAVQPRSAVIMFIEGESVAEATATGGAQSSDETVRRLTQELELTQSRLRTTREESEAANEELRAANEELQSINEEYRSTSEELETSKEELQSINEELQTVNSELKLKLEAISRAHSDLQNLMAATDFGTLFLDSTLRIKRFTDRVRELFSITPMDEGRPISDFAHQLEYDHLITDMRAVLSDLAPVRREIHSRNNRWFDVRMRPYRTVDDRIDGVVITFVDITDRLGVEEALRKSEQLLRQQKQLVELSREPIFVWRFDDGAIIDWNRGCQELYGYSRSEAVGQRKQLLLRTDAPGSSLAEVEQKLIGSGSWTGELSHEAKDGRVLTLEARLQLESFGDERLVLESTRDITDRKRWEERQQMLLRELSHRVKNTLAVVQAIARQSQRTSATPQEFVQRFEGRIDALASAHNLLMQSEWAGADLEGLARQQLGAYATESGSRVRIEGPAILLPPDLATPLGLVLHELATNAAKFGALSAPAGTIDLSWNVTPSDRSSALKLVWREAGGPPMKPPGKAGLGSSLIDGAIPEASVERVFNHDGLICTITIPLASGSSRTDD
jgi:two-component system CheB/CheR fusion protein